jgi:hypothetical protein
VNPTIFLDVDGVLADFMGAACRLHHRDPLEAYEAWPLGVYDVLDVWGISGSAFWDPIHRAGADFWANLDLLPDAMRLYEGLRERGHVVLLTSPSRDASSLAGKCLWMQRHFGASFRDYLVGPAKRYVARAGAFLVDDFHEHTDAFTAHCGHGVLFPQLWNPRYDERDHAVDLVLGEVDAALRGAA